MLRARVCDPLGPRWTRAVATALAFAAVAFGPLVPADGRVRAATALVALAFLFGRRFLRVRYAPRDAGVVLGADSIRVVNAGVLGQRVRAWDVLAASTARTEGRVALALVRRGSVERPLLLEFATDEELDRVRRSLGIGHRGFGVVAWPTAPRGGIAGAAVAYLAIPWLAIAACAAFGVPWLALTLALPVVPVTGVALLAAGVLGSGPAPQVALRNDGVFVVERWGKTASVSYADVVDVHVEDHALFVETRAGFFVVMMRGALREEREHIAAQIRSAAQRARGEGPPPPGVPASLAVLARRTESTRAWLERVDAAAASLASPIAAYRLPGLDPDDLWTALESPDVPARVRVAAARVLARVAPAEARERIAHVLATDHDNHARACIRVALEENVDEVARELERLDAART